MPIYDRNFREKDSVTSCSPTNSPSPIWTLGQPLIFGFETIWTIGTCIQLVTTKSMNFFPTFEKVGQLRYYNFFNNIIQFWPAYSQPIHINFYMGYQKYHSLSGQNLGLVTFLVFQKFSLNETCHLFLLMLMMNGLGYQCGHFFNWIIRYNYLLPWVFDIQKLCEILWSWAGP